jgi:hypothetical protein
MICECPPPRNKTTDSRPYSALCADCNELITDCSLQSVAVTCGARSGDESPTGRRTRHPRPAARAAHGRRAGGRAIPRPALFRRTLARRRQGSARPWLTGRSSCGPGPQAPRLGHRHGPERCRVRPKGSVIHLARVTPAGIADRESRPLRPVAMACCLRPRGPVRGPGHRESQRHGCCQCDFACHRCCQCAQCTAPWLW